jgi:uncharacterized protein (UPF0210 family)
MLHTEDILTTLRMFQDEHLDVRTVTMGIQLTDCAGPNIDLVCRKARQKIQDLAGRLVAVGKRAGRRYGIPIVNYRLAVTPVAVFGAGHGPPGMTQIAQALDEAASDIGVDFIGGFSALVHKGSTRPDDDLLDSIPEALSVTERVCGSVNVASSRSGINVDAILHTSRSLRELADRTSDRDGFGCAKVVVFANMPEDNPFMAGAVMGLGEPECVVNVGVSGPGVVMQALRRLRTEMSRPTLGDIADEIKSTAFRVTRIGELIGSEVAEELGVRFGILDLSLAPTPRVGDSVGEILQQMGIARVGAAGSTAALALLADAVKKGGAFASSSVGGLSGAFIPVSEDAVLAEAVGRGDLCIEKLEAMTSVCSVGLDMIAVPGDTSPETLAAIIADEAAVGVVNGKTTACRLIPVPGKKAGERAVFGGLFGESPILAVRSGGEDFVRFGGHIPAPIHSLRN